MSTTRGKRAKGGRYADRWSRELRRDEPREPAPVSIRYACPLCGGPHRRDRHVDAHSVPAPQIGGRGGPEGPRAA